MLHFPSLCIELGKSLYRYNSLADIWSFGITILELAHGHAPFARLPPMKVLLMTIQSPPPTLESDTGKKQFSKVSYKTYKMYVENPAFRLQGHCNVSSPAMLHYAICSTRISQHAVMLIKIGCLKIECLK